MPSNFLIRSSARLVLAAIVIPVASRAQSAGASVHPTPPPVANAARREGAVTMDGKLDEAAWQRATPITQFRQFQPEEGTPASLPMEVRILYDDQALYIGARMSEPEGVVAPLARRDQLLDANGNNGSFNSLTTDKLIVNLDPYHNHIDNAWFEVNPAGVKGDQFDGDPSWDPIWEAAAHVDSAGWTAELRIPFSQLRFSRATEQTWGMQIWRYIDRRNERDMWAFWRRNASGGPAFYGHLGGLTIASRARQLELLPYVVMGSTFQPVKPGDPYNDGRQVRMDVGGDLKYLLTSNLTLDASFNPDFGQVEVDPASLNLSAFETYYDEKRPFFVAGASAFDFGGFSCMFCSNSSSLSAFYSRRIGRPPQLAPYISGIAAYADLPDNAAILGAAKITGRTQSGYTVGLLDAVTNRERARYTTAPGAPEATQIVEPLTNYFVARVKKDLGNGATTIGGIVTSTIRQTRDSLVRASLRSHAEAGGIDWNHTWHRREYSWMGSMLVSNVAGSPAAIASTERSSARYFQRPDRHTSGGGIFDASYDTTATALRGYGLFTRVAKDNGTLLWEAMTNIRSPGFEVNDLAYLDRADYMWFNGNIGAHWTTPTSWYRSIFTTFGGATQYNYDGDRTETELQAFYSMEFPNYWNLRTFVIHDVPSFDDRLTRGGPVVKRAGYDLVDVEVSTDARSTAVFDFEAQLTRGIGDPTHSLKLSPGLALKPAANIFIQLSPTYRTNEDAAQFLTAVPDPTATAFYGTRYVFGSIRTRAISLDTRVNWTFTPDLTLQLYAQPFIASGNYTSFREFAAPRSSRKLQYGRDVGTIDYDGPSNRYQVDPDGGGPAQSFTFSNPDFTDTSLRGTAVLRWEYRPGSTLYLVWTQQRSGEDPDGDMGFGNAFRQIGRDRATNVFQIKATYWIGR
ncbi:MAG TPA: DUF5916 domain-containing protein [Gemmatimonadaceae bacterium]|nr:DUF5916 domain-containing protein [Gemmatimonadaceae bacterium]